MSSKVYREVYTFIKEKEKQLYAWIIVTKCMITD